MLFSWFTNRARGKILVEPFPPSWLAILENEVGHYRVLPAEHQKKLRDAVQIMIAEKTCGGCRGLELTDTIRVTIAALAAVLVLGKDDYYFDEVATILVYPDEYVARQERAIEGGATIEEDSERLGEAHHRGPVIVSWKEVRENALQPGYGTNLVFHEFAHKLDMLNGEIDGTPDLATDDLARRWSETMNVEFKRLQRAERRGRQTLLDPYGAGEPGEFFAVVTECFFDAPQAMRAEHPDLYALFREYFRQDPAEWPPFAVPS